MAIFISKQPKYIEAISFDELVEFGKANGANIQNGMPWSFNYKENPVTHENDECYLIGMTGIRMTKSDMLIVGAHGEIEVVSRSILETTYEPVI